MNTRKDNPNKRQKRGVMTRKIARNMLKQRIGNNRIREAWHQFQEGRYAHVRDFSM
jgi:hypothetical protein